MKQKARLMPRVSERLAENLITSRQLIQIQVGRYAFAAQFTENKIILDVACGGGFGSSYLMSNGAKEVVGGDISKDAIEYAVAHHKKDGLYFFRFDVQQLPFPDSLFDVVVSLETIEHLEKYEDFLCECRRVLKDGGTFICSTPNKGVESPNIDKPPNPYHLKEFYTEEFYQLLNRYFKNVKLYGYIHYKERGVKDKLIGIIESLTFSLPAVFQTVVMKFVALVTTFIFRGYHPTRLEDTDEQDFDKILTDDFKPFPIQNTLPMYIFAVGEKK